MVPEELVLAHIAQVSFIARDVFRRLPRGCNLQLGDLVSMGKIGLIRAAGRYDPQRGTFKTYAEVRIRSEILDGLRGADDLGRPARYRAKQLERARFVALKQFGRPGTPEEIAKLAGLTSAQAADVDALVKATTGKVSLEAPDCAIVHSRQPTPEQALQQREIRAVVASAIAALPKEERLVISLYYYDELTMKEIGRVLGVHESRVSQIHTNAMPHLRRQLKMLRREIAA